MQNVLDFVSGNWGCALPAGFLHSGLIPTLVRAVHVCVLVCARMCACMCVRACVYVLVCVLVCPFVQGRQCTV